MLEEGDVDDGDGTAADDSVAALDATDDCERVGSEIKGAASEA